MDFFQQVGDIKLFSDKEYIQNIYLAELLVVLDRAESRLKKANWIFIALAQSELKMVEGVKRM